MGAERVDYYSDEEFQQALAQEECEARQEQERREHIAYLAELEYEAEMKGGGYHAE